MKKKNSLEKIKEYIEKYQGLTIALLSALVAVVSFLLKNSVFMNFKLYLSYFGINNNEIIGVEENHIFSIIWALIIMLTTAFTSFFSADAIYTYRYNYFIIKPLLIDISNIKKTIKKGKKENRTNQLDKLDVYLKRLKRNKKRCKTIYWKNIWQLISYHLLIVLCVAIVSFPRGVFETNSFSGAVIIGAVYASVHLFIFAFSLVNTRVNFRKNKKIIMEKYEKEEVNYSDGLKSYFFSRVKKEGITNTLCLILKHSRKLPILLVVSFILIIGLNTVSGYLTARSKKQFAVFQTNSSTYVVIYQNSDRLIAEEAQIDEDTLTINKNEQLVLETVNQQYHIHNFDKVNVTDN